MASAHATELEGRAAKNPVLQCFYVLELSACILILILLTLLPTGEVIARYFFRTGIPASSGFIAQLLLLAGIFTGMITTGKSEHLSISLIQYMKDSRLKTVLQQYTAFLSTLVATIIVWTCFSFIKIGLTGNKIGFIPDRTIALAMPLGYAVMAARFFRRYPSHNRAVPILAVLLGTVVAFPVIAKLIWGFDSPDWAFALVESYYDAAYTLRLPVILFIIIAAFTGTPLFIIIGGMAIILLLASGGEIDVVANKIYTGLTQTNIVAIPLFTLAGFFLSESKAGERLVITFRSFLGWLPGGMIIVTIIICAFFTSFTGASGVTILALGGILYSILSSYGRYPEKFSIGLLTSVGSIGLLFPPSLPIILVGVTSQTNVINMFLGGLIPGAILVVSAIIYSIAVSVKNQIPAETFNLKQSLSALKNTALEIFLPFFLLIGYFSGTFTLVEIGSIAVLYIFIAEVIIHREIPWKGIPQVFSKAIPITGGVLSILALSQALSYYIVDTRVPDALARWMYSAVESKYIFLMLLNLALLVVGCLMDIFSAILIVLPLIIPLGQAYGIDPVHLGILFVTNLEVGFLTPPIGMNLFLATYRFNKPFVEICRNVAPFLLIRLVVVTLVTYIPLLSTGLVQLFGQ